jgi:hypothetical protein
LPQFTETARQRFFALNDIANKREQMTKPLLGNYDNQNVVIIPDSPLAIFRDFEASCEHSSGQCGEVGSNGYH